MGVARVLLLLSLASSAHASMQDAISAAALLRDIAQPRILRVTLGSPEAAIRPSAVYGVLFGFEGCTWFYAAEYGNRIIGSADLATVDAHSLAARLRDLAVPAKAITFYPPAAQPTINPGQVLIQNACVIGALATLEHRLLNDAGIHDAGLVLLSYHVGDAERTATLIVDHCVLVFRDRHGWQCIDPRNPEETVPLDRLEVGAPVDSNLMALALRPRYPLKSARLLPIAASTLEQITTAALWRIEHRRTEYVP